MKNLRVRAKKTLLAITLSALLTGVTNLMLIFGVLSLYSTQRLQGGLLIAFYLALTMFDTCLSFWIIRRNK